MNPGFRRLIKPHDPKTWGQRLDLAPSHIKDLLECGKDKGLENALFAFADAFTDKVYARAIVEFSNVCTKDCLYCGIRKHMKVHRFTMSQEEVVACAEYAMGQGMGTLMLQSGELPTQARIDYMLDVVRAVRQRTVEMQVRRERGPDARVTEADLARDAQKGLSVALSLGELPSATYQRLFDAGAHRYLLRIETSSPELYARLHPPSHSFQQRLHCLQELQRIGFQVGTGVMVGVPYQRIEHMVQDLLFFRDFQPDMIGLGPYVVQEDTPLGQVWLEQRKGQSEEARKEEAKELFSLTTRMYALARVMLGDVNIAATTALQVLNPVGREIALQRGANVVMPIITPARFRKNYEIYANKPCIDEESTKCTRCLNTRVELAGKKLALDGGWYDPPHYRRKTHEPQEEHSEIEKG